MIEQPSRLKKWRQSQKQAARLLPSRRVKRPERLWTTRCRAVADLPCILQISKNLKDLLFVALFIRSWSEGYKTTHITFIYEFLHFGFKFTLMNLFRNLWLIQRLPPSVAEQSPTTHPPLYDESYFLLFPHTDSWCVLLTSNTSAQTSSMYRSLSLKITILAALAAMNLLCVQHSAVLCFWCKTYFSSAKWIQ